MLSIPGIYKDANENYITTPAIRLFMSNNNISRGNATSRSELFDLIIGFGNKSAHNKELVLTWFDDAALEGMKDIHVRYFPLDQKAKLLLKDEEKVILYLRSSIQKGVTPHLCSNPYNEELTLVSVRWMGKDRGRKIVFTYCKKLFIFDRKKNIQKSIDYPIVAEYYPEGEWLLVIAKPRSSLYEYNPKGFNLDTAKSTDTEKQINEVFDRIENSLAKEYVERQVSETKLKNRLFQLVAKYTQTPKEIKDILSSKKEQVDILKKMIEEVCYVQGKCYLPSLPDIQGDIETILEKHLSINWIKNEIFTQDRDAYPIKLDSTDSEKTSAKLETPKTLPLQKKSAFFDNKKMLHKSKSCENAVFVWNRKIRRHSTDDTFRVSITVGKNTCIFKFTEYTMKEDIDDVIFSIIGTDESTSKQ